MRTAIYARVSTNQGLQYVDNQLLLLREFCNRQGWTITQEYCDEKSGKNGDRENFKRLFQDASQRQFDMVLFYSLDRFSREGVLATLKYLEALTSYGVGYRSFTEAYLDSCGIFKDAVISILSTVAKQERIRLSERVHAGLQRARAKGVVLGRRKVRVDREAIRALRGEGRSWAEVVAATGLSKGTVQRAAV